MDYKLMNVWDAEYISPDIPEKDRQARISASSKHGKTPFPSAMCTELIDMPWYEQAIVMLMWFLFFSVMLYVPFIFLFLVWYSPPTAGSLLAALMAIYFIPSYFLPASCFHYLSSLNLKYFSYRGAWQTYIPTGRPLILAAPPHGLFPFGNILAMLALPRFAGFHVRGVAATAVLRFPIAGHLLRLIGAIDASRDVAAAHLRAGEVIGISSGGIAEIFETNAENGKECIILKSRGGICKLALQCGADIVPCYLFGNSIAFRVYYDSFGIMQWISRKLRISLVLFSGRWGLAIPYRTPILGVCGEPIPVPKVDNPSKEQIEELLQRLQTAIKELFDKHKASYGWNNVELIIK